MTRNDPTQVSKARRPRSTAVAAMIATLSMISACGFGPDPSSIAQRPSASASADPTKGWQTVRYGGLHYAVPSDWDVAIEKTGKYKVPKPTYAKGFCKASPNESLGLVLLTRNTHASNARNAVRAELENLAESFYSDRSPQLDIGQQKHAAGEAGVSAGISLAPSDKPCDGSRAVVVIRGWPAPKGSGIDMLIAIGELGLKDSPDPGDLARIINSAGG